MWILQSTVSINENDLSQPYLFREIIMMIHFNVTIKQHVCEYELSIIIVQNDFIIYKR